MAVVVRILLGSIPFCPYRTGNGAFRVFDDQAEMEGGEGIKGYCTRERDWLDMGE